MAGTVNLSIMRYRIKLSLTLSLITAVFTALDPEAPWRGIAAHLSIGVVIFLDTLTCIQAIIFILRKSTARRRWLGPLVAIACCGCIKLVFYFFTHSFFPHDPLRPPGEMSIFRRFLAVFYGGVHTVCLMYPVVWYFERLRVEQEEKVRLQRLQLENLLVRLNTLQQQMNPELFLGSLDTLRVDSGDEWTRDYAGQLSGIYRYLISVNPESHLVRLEEELHFSMAYFHIMGQRFEDSLQLSLEVGPMARGWLIPPLALQTVVENAIKHNALSPEEPLRLRIRDEGPLLIVENNLLPAPFSSWKERKGIGLENIKERYRLLGDVEPLIARERSTFVVKLPLLLPSEFAGRASMRREAPAHR